MKPEIKCEILMRGRFRCQTFTPSGVMTQDTGWFDNLILNQGLDQIGAGQSPYNAPNGAPYLNSVCSVGTGTTTPAITDTQLTSYGVASLTPGSGVWGATVTYNSGSIPYWSCVWQYTFAAGVATGTWSEIGVGNWYSNTNPQPILFSHALITTGGGSPTTVTVTGTESLIVTYELDYYINTTTNSYSFAISGVTYSGSYLRATVTTTPALFFSLVYGINGNNNVNMNVYNGTIGTITTQPSGTAAGGPNGMTGSQTNTYTNGTYFNSFQAAFNTGQGNVSGGISAFMINAGHGSWQFSVSPSIPKTSSYQLTIQFSISWARYP